jgi:hypothetical protein
MRFLTSGFFRQTVPLRPLIHGLKRLRSNSIRFFFLDNAELKIYFTAMGQARSPMTDFFIGCFFNGFCKSIKNYVATPRYAT